MAAIQGNHIVPFIRDQSANPLEFVNDTDKGAGKINEEFISWNQVPQSLVYWSLESMAPEVQTQMVDCDTGFQLWECVE